MKKTTLVVFLLLTSSNLFASTISPQINSIESEWADIYYTENNSQQKAHYPALIQKARILSEKNPEAIEPVIWWAILIATNAAFETPLKALSSIETAKNLLEHCIKTDPEALKGAALVVLGTLYYMTPGWPISFGDQEKANILFQRALEINPLSVDSNYFYADYLLSKDDIKNAQIYFKRAIAVPSRPNQQFADTQLKEEARTALINAQNRKLQNGKNKFLSLFSSAEAQ
ncbi:MAG: hypothetical protein QM500_18615 [Methylococcales bacterium]